MKRIPLNVQAPPPPPGQAPGAGAPLVPAWRLVAAFPHRLFFFAAMLVLGIAAGGWAWTMLSRTGIVAVPPLGVAQPLWHVLAMLFGFFAFFMFGFLFTAGPRWLDVATPPAAHWRPAGLVALAAALLLFLVPDEAFARGAAALYGLAWLSLVAAFARLVLASRAKDKVHATLVTLAMAAGASGPLAYAALANDAYPWLVFAGTWLFAVPVFVVVCHRMIPFFTANVLPTVAVFRPWWLLAALVAGPVAHGGLEAAGVHGWTWLVDVPLALLAFDLARRWGLVQSLANRLLAMLHLGFVWYGIAFALFAASSLLTLAGAGSLGHAGFHALGMGFCGSLMIAMVSRVTFGHSGRALAADMLTWGVFLLLQAAIVARLAAALWPYPALLAATALAWAACMLPWVVRNLPVYWRPRADGKPG